MNVSFFAKKNKTREFVDLPIDEIFDKIKSGFWKDSVAYVRAAQTKEEYSERKEAMPSFTLAGSFRERRTNANLDKASGIVSLDIDNKGENKDKINRTLFLEDPFVHSLFSSIGGEGLVLNFVVDTTEIESAAPEKKNEVWLTIFLSLEEYIKNKYGLVVDAACKDISRPRYISFDPDLFLSGAPTLWTGRKITPKRGPGRPPKAPEPQSIGDFSNVLLARACALITASSDGGRHEARRKAGFLCGGYLASGILDPATTLDRLLDAVSVVSEPRAYEAAKKTILDGFEEGGKKPLFPPYVVNKILRNNTNDTTSEILATTIAAEEGLNVDLFAPFVAQVLEENSGVFWTVSHNEETGVTKTSIETVRFINWLNSQGFRAKKEKKQAEVEFIKITDNIISRVFVSDIRKYVRDYVSANSTVLELINMQVRHLFSVDILDGLSWFSGEFMRDTPDCYFCFFADKWITVTKEDAYENNYADLPAYVWDTQLIKRNAPAIVEGRTSVFLQFMQNITGGGQKLAALRRAFGYLLHSYKDPANTRAVILLDQIGSFGKSEGGTGKGLLMKAISHMLNLVELKGATMDFNDTFVFQQVEEDTRVIFIDEYDSQKLNFKDLFSEITSTLVVNRKFKQSFSLPFETSPKIVLATNQVVIGEGSSFERRKIEIALLPHYSNLHTPLDEFGKRFFTEWNEEDWNDFYLLCLECVKEYLEAGLDVAKNEGIEQRSLVQYIGAYGSDFMDYVEHLKTLPGQIWANYHYNAFMEISQADRKYMTVNKFKKGLELAGFKKHKQTERQPPETHQHTYFLSSGGDAERQ